MQWQKYSHIYFLYREEQRDLRLRSLGISSRSRSKFLSLGVGGGRQGAKSGTGEGDGDMEVTTKKSDQIILHHIISTQLNAMRKDVE